ncbi:hypothetical protein MKW94_016169, partial [Papaver nudicaule]|nr:hypothetical protein [Papaver nudicaule]
VIGILVSTSAVKVVTRSDGKETTIREVFIENMRGQAIQITLWGNSTDLISGEIIERHSKPVILIAVSTYVKEFRGKYSVGSTNATKLYYNLSIPEVEQLKKRSIAPIRGRSMVGELAFRNRKNISELLEAVWDPKKQENNIFSCRATIQNIVDLRSYSSCEKCSKKVQRVRPSNETWCNTCQMDVISVPRYRLEMEVEDSTGTTSFVSFDREVENLILTPATDMLKIEQGDHPAKVFENLYLHHELQQVKNFTAQKMYPIRNSKVAGGEMINSEPEIQEMMDTDKVSLEEKETKRKRVTTSDVETAESKKSKTCEHILSTIKTEQKGPECEGNQQKDNASEMLECNN